MRQVADGVWQVSGPVPNMINSYVAEDVLIDTGSRHDAGRILAALQSHPVTLVGLTHVHPDHQGSAHEVCTTLDLPLACHPVEVKRMEGAEPMPSKSWYSRLSHRIFSGPPHPVNRTVDEGDEVAGFKVLFTPGHSPGHVIYFRERDGVAIVGDVLNNMNIFTGLPGLHRPPDAVNERPELVNDAIRRVVDLEPRVVAFGHGPVLRDAAKRLKEFARGL